MITPEQLAELRTFLKRGDLVATRLLYQRATGKAISARSVEKFVRGERAFTDGEHQAIELFKAACEAVLKRRTKEIETQKLIDSVLESTRNAAAVAATQ